MVQQSSIKPSPTTKEDLTFLVDYNDPTAVDPPVTAMFCTQAAITQFLTVKGTTAFKHLTAVFKAFPDDIKHNVTINVAAGVHRPRVGEPTYHGWVMPKKVVVEGKSLIITGTAPSTWTPFDISLVGLTITGLSTPNSEDPWVDVSGTPFTGFDLRGSYVVFDTGQAVVIHKHTNSRLYIMQDAGPTPTTISRVARPSTILRNSFDDLTTAYTSPAHLSSDPGIETNGGAIELRDMTIQSCGGYNFSYDIGIGGITRVLYDMVNPFPYGTNGWTFGSPVFVSLTSCSWIGPVGGGNGLALWGAGGAALFYSYMYGVAYGVWCDFNSAIVLYSVVFDNGMVAATVEYASQLQAAVFFTDGKRTEVRNTAFAADVACFIMNTGSYIRSDVGLSCIFTNNAVPALRLDSGATFINIGGYAPTTLIDGGGNTDVGIEMRGPNSGLTVDSRCDVTGTLGDIRMADGDIWSYDDIKALGPIDDPSGNIVKVQ
jgi:hypothetical protein